MDDDLAGDARLDEPTLEMWSVVQDLAEQHAQTLALLDRSAALRSLPRRVVEAIGADMSFAAQREGDAAVIRALHGARARSLVDLAVPLGRGLGGHVLALGTPSWVAEYAYASTISHEFDVPVGAEGLVGVLAVPLSLGPDVLGVAYAGFRDRHEFGDVIVERVLELGRQTAVSMHVADRAQAKAQVAVQAERQRVAADLHDTLGAMLFSIGAQVRSLRGQYDQDAQADRSGGALVARLAAIEQQLSDAGAALRESLSVLHQGPPEMSLASTTQADVLAFRERTGMGAQVVLLTELPRLDQHRTAALVAAAREALLNVEKHSGASSVVVTLAHMDRGVLLAVTDNGRGLDGDDDRGDGLGLLAAQERVARLGGRLTLTADDGDGDGATLRAWVPNR